jgi:drug/metabolite transporter (DMT)-like permease
MALEVPPPEPHLISSAGRTGSTLISVVLLVVSVLFATAGQLTLKSAMDSIGRIGTAQVNAYGETIGRAIREPKLWVGLMLFGISAVFWLVVLSRVNLSIAYPVVGFSYIVVVAMSRWVFGEEVPTLRWIGVFVIAIGIALVGISSRTLRGG